MIRWNLCDCRIAYIQVKGTIQGANVAVKKAAPNDRNEKVTFKNCAPFINCITRINNTYVDDVHVDLDKFYTDAMLMYSLIEYSGNCSKTSGSLYRWTSFRR